MKIIRIHILLFVISSALIISCNDDKFNSTHGLETYAEFLDSMVLDCPGEKSIYYFEGIINGQQTCYYDSVDGRKLFFGVGTSFVTPGPSFTTGENISDIKRGAKLSFMPYPNDSKDEFLWITFPFFKIERDTIEYLDSLFSIEKHEVKSDLDGSIFDKSYRKFEIALKMIDERGLGYSLSTIRGSQEDSYITIKNVKKTFEKGIIHYYIEMKFECNLYHNSQYAREGLWSRIEDGTIIAKFPVR